MRPKRLGGGILLRTPASLTRSLLALIVVVGAPGLAMAQSPTNAAQGGPPMTRAAFAQALVTALKATPVTVGPYFSDVPTSLPERAAIETVAGSGWLPGVSLFQFAPSQPVTRLEVAQALVGALGLTNAAQELTATPKVSDAAQIPASDDGVVDLALALGLVPAVQGAFDPNGTVTPQEAVSDIEAEEAVTPAQIEQAILPLVQSLWVGIPWYSPVQTQNLSVGGTVQLADQISYGELVLPGPVTWQTSCGTLTPYFNTVGDRADELFTAPDTPGTCTVTASVPGTSVTASTSIAVFAPSALSFAASTPTVTTAGHTLRLTGQVLSLDPTGSGAEVTDLADSGTALTLTVTGPTGSVQTLKTTDQGGLANFSWTPDAAGTYTLSLSAPSATPSLSPVSTQIEVSPVRPLTASATVGATTLTYPGSTPLTLSLTPVAAAAGVTLPATIPVSVSVQSATGSVQLTHAVSSVALSAAEAAGGTVLADVAAQGTPGTATVTVSSPNDLFAPVSLQVTVTPSGTLTVTAPTAPVPAGSTVTVAATLTGAPAGTTVTFTPIAPDGEMGLLSTKSEVNSTTAQTDAAGVATASLPDQYMSGTYTLQVDAPGYPQATAHYTVAAGPAVSLAAVVAPSPFLHTGASALLSVAPVDRFGNPVPGVRVPVTVQLVGTAVRYTPKASEVTGEGTVGTVMAGTTVGTASLVVHTPAFHGQTLTLPVRVIASPLSLLAGKGTWLTYGAWASLGTRRILQELKAQGMQYVYLETAASCCSFYGQLPLDRFLDAAHDAGIAVITWNYDALTNVSADEQAAQQALAFRTRLGSGTDGFTADLEQNLSPQAVGAFAAYVRGLLGPNALFTATIYPPQDGFATPLSTLGKYVNALAPMDYWHGLPEAYTFSQVYQYVTNSITQLRASLPQAAVQVIAEAYDIWDTGSGPAEGIYSPSGLEEEAAILAATEAGATGISFYDLQTETPAEAQVIAAMPYPFTPVLTTPIAVPQHVAVKPLSPTARSARSRAMMSAM